MQTLHGDHLQLLFNIISFFFFSKTIIKAIETLTSKFYYQLLSPKCPTFVGHLYLPYTDFGASSKGAHQKRAQKLKSAQPNTTSHSRTRTSSRSAQQKRAQEARKLLCFSTNSSSIVPTQRAQDSTHTNPCFFRRRDNHPSIYRARQQRAKDISALFHLVHT